jgi:hypothetical protein
MQVPGMKRLVFKEVEALSGVPDLNRDPALQRFPARNGVDVQQTKSLNQKT